MRLYGRSVSIFDVAVAFGMLLVCSCDGLFPRAQVLSDSSSVSDMSSLMDSTVVEGGSICSVGEVLCGGTCTSLQDDEAHCGNCSRSCQSDQYCSQGFCRDCNLASCSGSAKNRCTDVDNCGACGNKCSDLNLNHVISNGYGCEQGLCEIVGCVDGYMDCNRILWDGCECRGTCDAVNRCVGEVVITLP